MLSDPIKIGPGVWYSIHVKAKLATTSDTKEDFFKEIYFHYHNFPCANCRSHIQRYVDTHPLEEFHTMIDENGVDVGPFKWTWYFHNSVNKRLGKPYLSWNEAYKMYELDEGNIKPCTDCGDKIDKKAIIQGYFRKKFS
jgi:hypothetical protein